MIKTVLVNALGLKLAAAALAAAVGGLAFAASTGVLPSPLNPAPAATNTPGNDGNNTPSGPVHPSPTGLLRTTGPQQTGWCTAYLNAGSAEEKNKHLTADLIAAAGGADKVTDYCIALVGSPKAKPSHVPAPKNSPKGNSSAKPDTPANTDPSRRGKPSVLPSHP